MTRILIPITFLACLLLVGGCRESISPEKYKELSALADTIVAQHDTLEAVIRGILGYIPYQHCPPCPDSTSMQSQIIIDGTRMPEGRWVTTRQICAWCETGRPNMVWPDSAYILKGE